MTNSTAHFIVLGSWSIFFLVWLVNWFKVKPTQETQSTSSRLTVAWMVGFGLVFVFVSNGQRIIPDTRLMAWIGTALSLAGLVIALWARWVLAGNWSANVTFKEGHELIQRGPYRFVRHPIYTGFLSMMLASALISGRPQGIVGVAMATGGFWFKLRVEEDLMTRHFPDAYPAYKARVKALIPWFL